MRVRLRLSNAIAVLVLVALSTSKAHGQSKPEDLGLTALHVRGRTGIINFYVSADPANHPPRKPLFVFLQGSQARPFLQVQRNSDGRTATKSILLFDVPWVSPNYHYVVIGKRGMPFIADTTFITPVEYYEWSSLENRAGDVNDVIEYLLRQPWVDQSRVVVVGHSQGADVAAKVAATNPHVTHVACLSGGGLTQMYEFVLSHRKRALRGEETFEDSQASIEKLYAQFREIYQNPSTEKLWDGESYAHWRSFFAPIVDSLVKVNIPVFVAIGNEDTSVPVESADIIPVEFIRLGKTNLTYRVLPGVDHSLGGDEGQREVIKAIFDWIDRGNRP